ncbi:hypothetical protein TWF569_002492 (mitochondrion) [Orbilia oligospora]|uniref:Uncharacterized protein n=2 Tax=Orbilia oligospora TaxID=2813651 RepID=A0A7C8J6A8_ORBOL|nr:hypothetical protein TWF706_002118 [Orbilia oligospora]KAF3083240.1 hypothetical protein TWF102_000753 [Orbilia oligospora]KAF3090718.1 hypothetical protein TWF103_011857 [Orbilia oligospora]KAF3121785.1 hypothetical protein TWF569_002492 [Orbilia oligospora]KAF3129522.1 hypothetical protein TWF594_010931 [Orbilia oligospora]
MESNLYDHFAYYETFMDPNSSGQPGSSPNPGNLQPGSGFPQPEWDPNIDPALLYGTTNTHSYEDLLLP